MRHWTPYTDMLRARFRSRKLVTSLALTAFFCYTAKLLYRPSSSLPAPSGGPVLVLGDQRYPEHNWVAIVNGRSYGAIEWKSNNYRRRSTTIIIRDARIDLPLTLPALAALFILLCGTLPLAVSLANRVQTSWSRAQDTPTEPTTPLGMDAPPASHDRQRCHTSVAGLPRQAGKPRT
jgi:hypothetical protein